MSWLKYLPLAMPLCIALVGYVGCENAQQVLEKLPVSSLASNQRPVNSPHTNSTGYSTPAFAPPSNAIPAAPARYANTVEGRIRIGSFNIQAFGPSKMGDAWVMERLAAIARNFDILAIQEIRSKDQEILNVLLNYVNRDGSRYNYLLGPRLGRSSSKEQYAYLFNTRTVTTSPDNSYTVRDDEDLLHREPLVARFAALGNGQYRPFTFALANVHTDPDEVGQEVAVLGRVFQSIANYEASVVQEDDIIMVGDFNADAKRLAGVASQREFTPVIINAATNVRGTAQYDNILLNPFFCTEFTGNAGVFDIGAYFGITQAEVLRLSDHLPVWAEFNIYEAAGGAIAADSFSSNTPLNR